MSIWGTEYKGHSIDLELLGRNEHYVVDYASDCIWCDSEAGARRIIDDIEAGRLTYYDGYYIEHNVYGKGEYTVFDGGDDVWFTSLQDAKVYIDRITEGE